MAYDTIHNIASKDQQHLRVQPSGTTVTQKKTSYDWTYSYGSAQPHAPSLIGDHAYSYDLNGNQLGWDHTSNGTRRTILWDEENRIQEVADNGHAKTYKYDDAGERVIKRGPQGETAYVNQFYTIRNREVGTKHVFAGGTRLVSKLLFQPKDSDGDGVADPFPGCENAPWGWLPAFHIHPNTRTAIRVRASARGSELWFNTNLERPPTTTATAMARVRARTMVRAAAVAAAGRKSLKRISITTIPITSAHGPT